MHASKFPNPNFPQPYRRLLSKRKPVNVRNSYTFVIPKGILLSQGYTLFYPLPTIKKAILIFRAWLTKCTPLPFPPPPPNLCIPTDERHLSNILEYEYRNCHGGITRSLSALEIPNGNIRLSTIFSSYNCFLLSAKFVLLTAIFSLRQEIYNATVSLLQHLSLSDTFDSAAVVSHKSRVKQ